MRILKMSEREHWPEFAGFQTLSPEELAQASALAKAAFTAEDLQRFTETDLDQGIPMEVLLQEMEEAQRKLDQGTA